MHVTIKTTGIELTPAIEAYVREKFAAVEHLVNEDPASGRIGHLAVEVGKTTDHHRKGDFFHADATLSVGGDLYRVEEETDDLYSAIDVAKDEMVDVLSKKKDKKLNVFRAGARAIKRMLRME